MTNTHENLTRKDDVQIGSNRTFGVVFTVVFSLIALWPLMSGQGVRIWAVGVSILFLALAFVAPGLLRPLNLVWFKFGLSLHKVVNPVVMGLLFLTTIIPIGLVMRAFGKDPLRLKPNPEAKSYWIDRDPEEITPDSMRNQF